MKLKKIILINSWLLVILLQCTVLNASASVKPIIISDNRTTISSTQNSVPLTWTIIDDNPNYYQILQNGSILKNNTKIMSDLISYDFSSVAGIYNITLIIFDYSGYHTQDSTIVNLLQPSVTSTTSSGASQNTSAATVIKGPAAGTPGYSYILTLFTIVIITITYITKRSKSKRS